jgi:hypothetical protein
MKTQNSLESKKYSSSKHATRNFAESIIPKNKKNSKIADFIFKQQITKMNSIQNWRLSKLSDLGLLSLVYLLKEYAKKDTLYGKNLDIIEDVSSSLFSTEPGKLFVREINKITPNLLLNKFEFESKYKDLYRTITKKMNSNFRQIAESTKLKLKEILVFMLEKSKKRKMKESIDENLSMYSMKSTPSNIKRIMQVGKQRPDKPEESSQYTLKMKNESLSSFRVDDHPSLWSHEAGFSKVKNRIADHDEHDLGKMSFGKFNQLISQNIQKGRVNNSDSFDSY